MKRDVAIRGVPPRTMADVSREQVRGRRPGRGAVRHDVRRPGTTDFVSAPISPVNAPRQWRYQTRPSFKRVRGPLVDVFNEAEEVLIVVDLGGFTRGEISLIMSPQHYILQAARGEQRFSEVISTTLALPLIKAAPAVTTGATPLAALKFDHQLTPGLDLALGTVSGSAGETSAVLILLGGAYLAWRRMLDWRIPVGILATVFLLSGLLHLINRSYPPPVFMLLSGGLMLGAVYMATDMVTSPVTPVGVWIFAFMIGALTVIIRIWGGLPEGVMYAILLANGLTPLINLWTQPRIYGERKKS